MQQFYTYLHSKPDGTPFYVGKGRVFSGEHRAKKSASQIGEMNHRFGKVGTMTGRKHSPESIARMVAMCKVRDEKRRLLKMQEAN